MVLQCFIPLLVIFHHILLDFLTFCVPSSWILSVAINGELAGRQGMVANTEVTAVSQAAKIHNQCQ